MIGARRSRDAGFSLVEVLVTVVIIGIAFVVFVGGMGTAIIGSDHQRKLAVSQSSMRNFAEAIKAAPYQDCATVGTYGGAYSPTPPDRPAASTTFTSATAHSAPSVTPQPGGGAVLYFYGVAADTTMTQPSETGLAWVARSTNVDPSKRVTAAFADELWTSDDDTSTRTSSSAPVQASSVVQTVMLSKSGTLTRRPIQSNAATGTTSLQVNTPSGTTRGDAMVAQLVLRASPTTTVTEPAGWVLVSDRSNGTTLRSLIYQRTATAQEAPSYAWSFSSANDAAGGIVSYTGVGSGYVADITGVTYWDGGNGWLTSCPAPDAGLQKIKLKVISRDAKGTSVIEVIKRRP